MIGTTWAGTEAEAEAADDSKRKAVERHLARIEGLLAAYYTDEEPE